MTHLTRSRPVTISEGPWHPNTKILDILITKGSHTRRFGSISQMPNGKWVGMGIPIGTHATKLEAVKALYQYNGPSKYPNVTFNIGD